jgi:hypothetical protein
MSSMKIVLVDPLGEVLFSGESWLANASAEPDDDDDCPETMRSGESGIFPVERPKSDERAA